jgi:GTP cyclohydrolase I
MPFLPHGRPKLKILRKINFRQILLCLHHLVAFDVKDGVAFPNIAIFGIRSKAAAYA